MREYQRTASNPLRSGKLSNLSEGPLGCWSLAAMPQRLAQLAGGKRVSYFPRVLS